MNISNTTPLLDQIDDPAALRGLPKGDLRQLADELRQELIDVVSVTGGHLGAGLGVGAVAGLDIGVGADSAPLGVGEATGELSAFGEGDGLSFAVLPFVRV